ncbi:MAG: hypothetical protein NTX61_01620 [Bacteroidetes bacterium]|nr:hypothetical protein [Bacteroidota bacterium]
MLFSRMIGESFLLPLSRESSHDKDQIDVPRSSKPQGNVNNLKTFTYTLKGNPISIATQDSIRKDIDSLGLKQYINKNFAENNWAFKLLMRQAFKILIFSGQSFKTILEHTASKMIFILIPVFALLLKLCYRRNKRLYFEHLIFSLHIHAFVFLLLIFVMLIQFLVPVKMLIVIIISLVYLFFAIKRNYGERTGKALRQVSLLIFFYCIIALPVFFIMLILVSIFLV